MRLASLTSKEEWDEALGVVQEMLQQKPHDAGLLWQKFQIYAVGMKNPEAARAVAEALKKASQEDAQSLNNYAWFLMTEEKYGSRYDDLALHFSERSNELTDYKSWAYVDTLALARFRNGKIADAIELQRKAISLCQDEKQIAAMKKSLKRYEEGLHKKARKAVDF